MIAKKVSITICTVSFISALIALIYWSADLRAMADAPKEVESLKENVNELVMEQRTWGSSLDKYVAVQEEREEFQEYKIEAQAKRISRLEGRHDGT